eukprot:GEMP01028485.1.p1 GENE.GEMP01028485.1~~GEMP01028485.1.p1  ORF type:complete len:294 (+),score=80.61 GEMP01028485.1:102-983(+)
MGYTENLFDEVRETFRRVDLMRRNQRRTQQEKMDGKPWDAPKTFALVSELTARKGRVWRRQHTTRKHSAKRTARREVFTQLMTSPFYGETTNSPLDSARSPRDTPRALRTHEETSMRLPITPLRTSRAKEETTTRLPITPLHTPRAQKETTRLPVSPLRTPCANEETTIFHLSSTHSTPRTNEEASVRRPGSSRRGPASPRPPPHRTPASPMNEIIAESSVATMVCPEDIFNPYQELRWRIVAQIIETEAFGQNRGFHLLKQMRERAFTTEIPGLDPDKCAEVIDTIRHEFFE